MTSSAKGTDMRDWPKEFNALPESARIIGAAMEIRTRMQHLRFEKGRLTQRYKQSSKEINEHMRNCEKLLLDLERRHPTA
jgi:hypothetical protein